LSFGELLGFAGVALVATGLIPQLIRVFKLKSANEISLLFTILFLIGVTCWLIYGILFVLPPVIFWNAINALFISGLLFAKLKYGRQPDLEDSPGVSTGANP
jgi:MtN3 and saliva related transmembrane protein